MRHSVPGMIKDFKLNLEVGLVSTEVTSIGRLEDGREVKLYSLSNSKGVRAEISDFGGIVASILVPDRHGRQADVILGYKSLEGFLKQDSFFGALVGRHANRIEGAVFELNGISYKLAANDGKNHLHGGSRGFDKKLWDARVINDSGREGLELGYLSRDGEENYPGNLEVKVTYSLTDDNELVIDYYAETDKDTVVNLTNHSYFNLGGHFSGDILKHELMINADFFTPINNECVPTGEIRSVKGTPMDFTVLKPIGEGIASGDEQIRCGNGYDHNWVLKVRGEELEKAAELYEPESGRVMEVYTTKPGVQFYSGNFMSGSEKHKDGAVYSPRSGMCLETQYFPNAMKYRHFPSPVLKAGEIYHHTTIYKFLTR